MKLEIWILNSEFFRIFAFSILKEKKMETPTLEQKVKSIISQIRPYLQQDGGDIEFIELTADNVVKVKLQGACGSCPHAKMTLKNGVEQTLKHYLPEIDHVEDIILGFWQLIIKNSNFRFQIPILNTTP